MKRFLFAIALVLLTACGTSKYVSQRRINDMDEISLVLYNNYPVLHEYYMEGVLEVNSLKEVTLENGETAYNIKYKFIKYRYPEFNDRMAALKEYYPEVYDMYMNGVIEVTSFYKYVDDSGVIRHHVSFRRIYDFYYNDSPRYGGVRLIYRPRPYPMFRPSPPRPRPAPGPRPGHGGRPGGGPRGGRR